MNRHVKGILFIDYVRMLRANKGVEWSRYLNADDQVFLQQRIDPQGWYPMDTFERMGLAILTEVAGGDLSAVRMWGRLQVEALAAESPSLLVAGDARQTILQVQTLRSALFDYVALQLGEVRDRSAAIFISYGMSGPAEEAACHQSLGFFERLVELAGGLEVHGWFSASAWRGDMVTAIELEWV